ncbi:GFA family protein [Bacterioplanoides sp. SCSIO 12839]|uniref:GFA family protein n=1 Tax=Bacterioplanoides sp. SCSIO 12839 TaxID=2829569 RepID=UPI002105D06C|nr:GFA family protein [Bacterioplanoides sp. SCSIO 12839]UTW47808.1 GFA family protein [Bacterioplanoides sp. SCSIO 12839]
MVNVKLNSSCSCGQCRVDVGQKPIARFYCHCSICQKIYQSNCADVAVVTSKNVQVLSESAIEFKKHKHLFALQRGTCKTCGDPVVATLFGLLSFLPVRNFVSAEQLPMSQARIFCCNKDKELPCTDGYFKSQLLVTSLIIKGLFS